MNIFVFIHVYSFRYIEIYIFFCMMYFFQKFKDCLNRLNIVNETLEKLGTSKNYIKLRKRIMWVIIEWIISTFFINIIDILWFSIRVKSQIIAICLALIINYSYHINVIYDFKYMILFGFVHNIAM